MGTEKVLSSRRRMLFRKQNPDTEIARGMAVLVVLAGRLFWGAAQHDKFDAGERDSPYELLAQQPVEGRLYRQPLKPWSRTALDHFQTLHDLV